MNDRSASEARNWQSLGFEYGSSCDFGWSVAENGVHVHDWQASVMHAMGVDHKKLTYRYQGRRFRLTDVHGQVKHELFERGKFGDSSS